MLETRKGKRTRIRNGSFGTSGTNGKEKAKEARMCYPAVIVSILIVTACAIAYAGFGVDRSFRDYFDRIENDDH